MFALTGVFVRNLKTQVNFTSIPLIRLQYSKEIFTTSVEQKTLKIEDHPRLSRRQRWWPGSNQHSTADLSLPLQVASTMIVKVIIRPYNVTKSGHMIHTAL